MVKLGEGKRIKVVAPDPFEKTHDACVGMEGVITGPSDRPGYAWRVILDGEEGECDFTEGELTVIGVRIVEGYVDDQGFVLEECKDGMRTAFMRVGKEYRGKYIRVTVEEMDKPADHAETPA